MTVDGKKIGATAMLADQKRAPQAEGTVRGDRTEKRRRTKAGSAYPYDRNGERNVHGRGAHCGK